MDKAPPALPGNYAQKTLEEKKEAINLVRVQVRHDISKLQKAVEFLLAKDAEWNTVIRQAPSEEELAAEEELYDKAVMVILPASMLPRISWQFWNHVHLNLTINSSLY